MVSVRILVLFASAHGQTRAIVEALSARLREHGAEVCTYDAEAGLCPDPVGYDVVGFGSRVHGGEHAPAIVAFGTPAEIRDSPNEYVQRFIRAAGHE